MGRVYGTPDTKTTYIYSGFRVVEELDDSDALAMEYVHGQMYIDEIILLDDQTTIYYFAHDRRYSTTALMNTSGSVVETYDYKIYGKRVASGSGLTEMGYTGRRHDSETGLMYFRNRYYSVDRGSFVTRDMKGYVDGASLYLGYFGGKGRDPFGYDDLVGYDDLDGLSPEESGTIYVNEWEPIDNVESSIKEALNTNGPTATADMLDAHRKKVKELEAQRAEALQGIKDFGLMGIIKSYFINADSEIGISFSKQNVPLAPAFGGYIYGGIKMSGDLFTCHNKEGKREVWAKGSVALTATWKFGKVATFATPENEERLRQEGRNKAMATDPKTGELVKLKKLMQKKALVNPYGNSKIEGVAKPGVGCQQCPAEGVTGAVTVVVSAKAGYYAGVAAEAGYELKWSKNGYEGAKPIINTKGVTGVYGIEANVAAGGKVTFQGKLGDLE